MSSSRAVVTALVVSLCLVGAAALLGGGVATQESNFEVNMSAPDGVDAGGDLTVTVTVTNRGPVNETQTVVLTDGEGAELDSRQVSLADRESTEIELTWGGVPDRARTVNPEVRSESDADAAVVTVRWAAFEVTELDPGRTTIEANGSFSVAATVRNVGTVPATRDVRLSVAGSEYAIKENVSIEAESFTRVRFVAVEPSLEAGTYPYTVTAGESSQQGTLTVEEPPEATFVVTSIDGSYADGTATVEAVVENQGNVEDTQSVTVSVEDEPVDERVVTLAPGESVDLTYTHEPESVPVNVTVSTEAPDAASVRVGQANIEFGPRVQTVTPADVELGDQISVTYTASGENLAETRLIVYGPDGNVVFETEVPSGIEQETAFEQSALSPYTEGSYDVALAVRDEFGRTDSHRITDAFQATSAVTDGPRIGDIVPEEVQADETLYVNYTARGSNVRDVYLTLTGPGGEERLNRTVSQGTNRQYAISPDALRELPGGPYDVTLAVHDAFGGVESTTREEAVSLGRQYNPDNGNFGADVYTTTAGDFVRIDVSLTELDEAYILLGEGRPGESYGLGGPVDILHVSGSASFVVNTRLFGTDRDGDAVYITEDGSVTSYAHDLGAGQPPSGVFEDLRFETVEGEQVATNLSDLRRRLQVSRQLRPLQPGSYGLTLGAGDSIVVRDDGIPDSRFPLDRAKLELTEPALGNLTTYRIPRGNADEVGYRVDEAPEELTPSDLGGLQGAGLQTNNITLGERVLVGFEASGLWGSLLDSVEEPSAVTSGEPRLLTPAEFQALLDRPEGVEFEVRQLEAERNTAVTGIDLFNATTDDVSVILDPYFDERPTEGGEIYVLMDTRPPEPFDEQPEAGQTFNVSVAYEAVGDDRYTFEGVDIGKQPDPFDPVRPGFPYFEAGDESEVRTTSFTIREQQLLYNQTTVDGRPIVTAAPDATIAGVTNYLPGDRPVRLVIDVQSGSRTVEIEDVPIGPNGQFAVQTDLSAVDPDDDVQIEFFAYEQKIDERPLAVFDDPESARTFEITNLETQTLVREDLGPIVNVSAVVENTGSLSGVAQVELLIDGEVAANKSVELDRNDVGGVRFPAATDGIEPGQHTIEVRTKDDLEGTIVELEARRTVFEIDSFSVAGSPTTNASQVTATATVVNTGTVRGAKPVELLLDGEVVGARNSTLLADEDLAAVFEGALGDLEPGNYTLTLRTPDDEVTRPLVVEEPSDAGDESGSDEGSDSSQGSSGEETGSEDDGPSDSGDAGPGLFVGVGAGSRAVVGGTAIVGAVYVLGYWV